MPLVSCRRNCDRRQKEPLVAQFCQPGLGRGNRFIQAMNFFVCGNVIPTHVRHANDTKGTHCTSP